MDQAKSLILLLGLCIFSGCVFQSGNVKVDVKKKNSLGHSNTTPKTISSVSVINNQIKVTGIGLEGVTSLKIQNNNLNETFTIESASSTQIIANATHALSIGVGQVFDLILSNAYGAATFPVSFSLDNGSVTAVMLSSMGASAGQILKYNGAAWVPSSISSSQLYIGTWNANTNTPDLNLTTPQAGDYYVVTTAGTQGPVTYAIGDWIISNGTTWSKLSHSSSVVGSFNGRTGLVVPTTGDYTWAQITKTGSKLEDIADMDITGRADQKILKWDGTNSKWIMGNDITGAGAPGPSSITTTEILDGTIANADLAGSIAQAKITNLTSDLASKLGLTSLSATAPLVYNNTTGGFTINNATIALDGAMSAADKTKLNGLESLSAGNGLLERFSGTLRSNTCADGEILKWVTLTGWTCGPDLSTDASKQTTLTNSAGLAAALSDESGTGLALFDSAPTITNPVIANISPIADFTLTQNAIVPFTSVGTGAVANTLYLKDGNVGIGTTTPAVKLAISNPTVGSQATSSVSSDTSTISLSAYSSTYPTTNIAGTTAITSSGTLDLRTSATTDAIRFYLGGLSSVGYQHLLIKSNTLVVGSRDGAGSAINSGTIIAPSAAATGATDLAAGSLNLSGGQGTGSGAGGSVIFNTAPSGSTGTTLNASIERARISSSGNFGIGTNSPGSTLDVKGILRLSGSTSGYVGFEPAAVAGATTYILPATQGTAGQVLTTDGVATNATLSWVTPATSSISLVGDIGGSTGANTIGTGKVTSTHLLDGTIGDADVNAAANIAITKLGTGAVSTTEFNYLTGVTSSIQTQLAAKEATLPTGATTDYIRGDKTLSVFATDVINSVLSTYTISALAKPAIASTDTVVGAFNKVQKYISDIDGDYVSKSASTGNTVSGVVTFNTIGSLNIGYTPTNATDAVSKAYVDVLGVWAKGAGGNAGDLYRATGNVGIGTSTPNAKLHVLGSYGSYGAGLPANGGIVSTVGTASDAGVYGLTIASGGKNTTSNLGWFSNLVGVNTYYDQTTDTLKRYTTSGGFTNTQAISMNSDASQIGGNRIGFWTGANADPTERMSITASGNVGIGTTTPSFTLGVKSSSLSTTALFESTNVASVIGFSDSGTTFRSQIGSSGNDLFLQTNGAERMRVLGTNGNVGIGTTNPTTALHVVGGSIYSQNDANSGSVIAALTAGAADANGGHAGIGVNSIANAVDYGYGMSRIDLTKSGWLLAGRNANAANEANDFFALKYTNVAGVTSEYFRVSANGNVGIGTTTPQAKLHVVGGGIEVDNSNPIYSYGLGMDSLSVDSKYTMFYTSSTNGALFLSGGKGTFANSQNDINFGKWDGSALTKLMTILSATGNVGIGIAAPRAKLDVAGTFVGNASTLNATSTIDFSSGNFQYTAANCGAFALNNMKDGGTYTFVVKGTTSTTCSFTAFSDAGVTGLTFHLPPDNSATVAGKHTIYTYIVVGTDVYASWVPGV